MSVRFHSSLDALDQIPVIRSRLGSKASKLVEANTEIQNALTVTALLDALENVFKPREVECSQALSQFRPEWNRSAVETVTKMKATYARYNCAYPDGSEKVLQLVSGNAFSSHAKQNIITQMQLLIAQQGTVTMSDLENVAEAYDTLHAQDACLDRPDRPALTLQNASSGMQTRARAAAARAEDHEYEAASMSGPGQGRGRNRGRGGGRRGGFQESRPAGPGDFSSGPAGVHTISLCGNAGQKSTAHVQLPQSAAAVAASAVAAQRNLRSRPYNAEPHIRESVETAPPAHAPPVAGPNQFDRYRARLGLPRSGVECLSSSNVQMSLGAMLEMAVDPEFQDACKPVHAYISRDAAHVHNVSARIPEGGVRPVAELKAAHESAPKSVTDAVKADVQKKPASYATVLSTTSKPTVSAAPVGKVVNAVLSAASAVQGKKQSGPVVGTWSMSMPTIKVKVDAGRQGTVERHMNLDTGATLNCISQTADNRDFAWLKGTGGTPVKLAPLELGSFNKGHSVIITMMQGVTLRIGCSLYCLDFVVVPDAQFDYLLGAPFMSAFAVKPNFRNEYAEIGCPKSADGRPIPAFQKVPMYFKGKNITLEVQTPRRYT